MADSLGQGGMDPDLLDDIIKRLTEVRLARPGKQVQLSENEIKLLCSSARDIFVHQPNLLELEAPIKVCGSFFFLNLPLLFLLFSLIFLSIQ